MLSLSKMELSLFVENPSLISRWVIKETLCGRLMKVNHFLQTKEHSPTNQKLINFFILWI